MVGSHAPTQAPSQSNQQWRFERTEAQMGVPFKIIVYAENEHTANKALTAAFERIAALNTIFSDYDPNSELSRLCRLSGPNTPITVSPELFDILTTSAEISNKSSAAFDVTVGPYVRLWRRARRQKELPDATRLEEAQSLVGHQKVMLDQKERTVELQSHNMRLDLGGIAKGYATDEAMRVLKHHGITSALIDASGDLLVSNPPPGKDHWTIGIAALRQPEGQTSEFLHISNRAVATSGDAYQFVEIDGQRYSHIVNPQTGMGLTSRSSVTVVAPNATLADAWASAVSVMGPADGLRALSRERNISALVMQLRDGKSHAQRSCDFPKTFAAE